MICYGDIFCRLLKLVVLWFFVLCLFFFFKQKTAYEMRISDWSSDVCSSDLVYSQESVFNQGGIAEGRQKHNSHPTGWLWNPDGGADEIGRASCRERVCQYV